MSALQRWLLHLSAALVAVSGAAYGILKYFGETLASWTPWIFPPEEDPFSAIHHPVQPWALALHVVIAPVLVFALGWIFKDHILAKARMSEVSVRRSGALGVALLLPMVLSGYLLQAVTNETLHWIMMLTHIGTGTLFAIAYVLHVALAPNRLADNGKAWETGKALKICSDATQAAQADGPGGISPRTRRGADPAPGSRSARPRRGGRAAHARSASRSEG